VSELAFDPTSGISRQLALVTMGERVSTDWVDGGGGAVRSTGIVFHNIEENAMIIRVFRPTIHPGKESEFESFLQSEAIPLVSRQSGS
jgi:hypothetical protein